MLSNFGMVPAAASGVPLKLFLEDALHGVKACDGSVPPGVNPGVLLGTVFGIGAEKFGRDKIDPRAGVTIRSSTRRLDAMRRAMALPYAG